MKQALLLFVKFPITGRVKSRLGSDIGYKNAAIFYSAFVKDMLTKIDRNQLDTLIFFDPAQSEDDYKEWLGNRVYYPQRGQDLGERMFNAFHDSFNLGYDCCVLTGSDLPQLPPQIIKDGLKQLREHSICIGPATDGGYYLIGFQKEALTDIPFINMNWSTPTVFNETVLRIKHINNKPLILPMHGDIDTIEDLKTLLNSENIQTDCPNTFAVSQKINMK